MNQIQENQPNQQLSNREQYLAKQQEKLKAQNLATRKRMFKRGIKITIIVLVIGGILGGLVWLIANQPKTLESEIISKSGIHWHPELTITVKGQKQEIPANIGIGITHESIHTHDATGTLHLEIEGRVVKNDIKLGRFFKIWGKQFSSNCIFEFCNSPNGKVKMTVNGQENNEFDNYLMKDGDKIEILYE